MKKLTAKKVLSILLMVMCTFMLTACDVTNEVNQVFNIALEVAKYVAEIAIFVFLVRLIIK